MSTRGEVPVLPLRPVVETVPTISGRLSSDVAKSKLTSALRGVSRSTTLIMMLALVKTRRQCVTAPFPNLVLRISTTTRSGLTPTPDILHTANILPRLLGAST